MRGNYNGECLLYSYGFFIGAWLEELNPILDKQYLEGVKRRNQIKDKIIEVLQ